MSARILVIEDETDIRDLIVLHLKRDGYSPDEAQDGEEALKRIQKGTHDLYIVDWMLPGLSGLEITRALRQEKPGLGAPPVLMVTARTEASDIVLGLEAGADDYVTKPFEIPVLMARVRALLRRAKQGSLPKSGTGEILEAGELKIHVDAHEVHCGGQKVDLTASEFKLVLALVRNPGRVLTRQMLIDLVQGVGVAVVDRAIDTHVFGLRKKLGDCGDLIETVRGVGYRVKG
jgi:two-component system, OmpR family, phosphate regulon response regulator PhoB